LLRDDDFLVRVRAAGVRPSVWHLIAELLSLLRIAALDFAPEAVCGYDVAIRVERSRENVTRFSLVTRCSARR
jgi:NADPH:quinone reductase-like Zn-dependent oxidoreductase